MITPEIKEELLNVGLDADVQIERFADSEEMFVKYFRRFFETSQIIMQELESAVIIGERGLIEAHAHALKGAAGNIGLDGVFAPAQKIVNDMRAGVHSDVNADFDSAKEAYQTALEILERLEADL